MSRPLTHLVVALVILVLGGGAYLGGFFTVKKEAQQVADLEAEIARLHEEQARVSETEGILTELTNNEAMIKSHVVVAGDIAIFLESLQKTGRALGAAVDVISVSDKPTPEGRLSLSLKITGSFDAVVRTLGALEYNQTDIRIENLVLDTEPTAKGTWTAATVFSVSILGAGTTTPAK